MPARTNLRPLTKRQREVLEAIALRKSIKQMANDAGISESAVNQHIRALKQNFAVNSLAELAQCYREIGKVLPNETCRKPICKDTHLVIGNDSGPDSLPDNMQPVVTFNDPLAYESPPPWALVDQPEQRLQVGPEVLNGRDANWVRAAAMVAVALGTLLVLLVGLGVAHGLSSALEAYQLASVP